MFATSTLTKSILGEQCVSGTLGTKDNRFVFESDAAAVMLVHGTDDQVVPFSSMDRARDVLATHGITAETVARPGLGHGIDPDALSAAIDFLARTLPA